MTGDSLLQTGLALALVLGLVLMLAWLLQRLRSPARQRALAVVSQVSLGQRERVVVVAWDGQEWMLGVGPGRVNLIAHREVDAVPATPLPHASPSPQPSPQGGEGARAAPAFHPLPIGEGARADPAFHPLPLGEGRGEGAVSRSTPTFSQALAQQIQQSLSRWSPR